MNKYTLFTIISALGLGSQFSGPATAQTASDDLIFPDARRKIVIVEATSANGRKVSGRIMPDSDSLAALALADLNLPFNASMIRMSQCARNLVSNTDGPNILFLSKNEGGFPRTGITLKDGNGKDVNYPELGYVDLVLDRNRISQGDLSIYTHELGHVMMGLILGDKLEKLELERSPKQHVSMGVTDYVTAFNEGWGVHFQRLAYDQTEKYRKAFDEKMMPERSMSLVWHSGMDEYLRLNGVKENAYIYDKLVQQGAVTDSMGPEQRILLDYTSPVFDHTRIKNAQQMLSCEGVLATLFYQVNKDRKLASNFLDADFYTPFLIRPIPVGMMPEQIFSPLENMLIKNFRVWQQMSSSDISGSPFRAWLENWCDLFPDDRREILMLFIHLTKGATVSPDLARLAEKLNYLGQIGEYQEFKRLMPVYQQTVGKEAELCQSEMNLLWANTGPELWVRSKSMKIRRALWMPENKNPFAVNLNTASLPEMEVFLDPEQAGSFIQKRTELGFFDSFKQIKEFGFQIDLN